MSIQSLATPNASNILANNILPAWMGGGFGAAIPAQANAIFGQQLAPVNYAQQISQAPNITPLSQSVDGSHLGENQTLVFDLDETLVSSDKINQAIFTKARGLGHQVLKGVNGHEYILRPGALELLQELKRRGHKIIVCSRNLRSYMENILQNSPIMPLVDAVVSREDLYDSTNKDFKRFPNHSNRVAKVRKFKSALRRYTIEPFLFMGRKFKYILGMQNNAPRMPEVCGTLNKYAPNIHLLAAKHKPEAASWTPAHFLIDNKFDNLAYSDRSGDWAYIDPRISIGDHKVAFFGDQEEPKGPDGQYIWVTNVLGAIDAGWRAQYTKTTGKQPKV